MIVIWRESAGPASALRSYMLHRRFARICNEINKFLLKTYSQSFYSSRLRTVYSMRAYCIWRAYMVTSLGLCSVSVFGALVARPKW